MLMNAAISSATTVVVLLGYSLPDWFKDLVVLVVFLSLLFSFPTFIRIIYNSIFEVGSNDKK